MTRHTTAEHSIVINRGIEDVFAIVSDATNDPKWCPRVLSCEQVEGHGPGPGARYSAHHNPMFMRKMTRDIRVAAFEAPHCVRWLQEDSNGVFHIEYKLEVTPTGVLFTQHDEIDWKISPFSVEVGRRIVPRHIRQQFERLKRFLEEEPVSRQTTA
jgi:hypothetical protein